MIRLDETLQYDINREAAKISALSFGKIHKYEYVTREEISPPDQRRMIEQAKFTYSKKPREMTNDFFKNYIFVRTFQWTSLEC